MKTNLFSYNSILFTLIIILISTITIWKLPQTQNGYTHIGIAVYDMDDTFINDYVTKLQNKIDRSSFSGKKVLYEIFDAEGNANRQEHQLQYMYTQNFDALLINLVTPSSAASVLNETANHDIPVILFNREADKKDLSISKQTWYVGTAAKKAGAIQADMLQNVWNIDKVNLDRNKNNKLDYILIEGEQTHFDAVRRTNGFLESSQNLPLNQLTNLSADWQRNLSSVKFDRYDIKDGHFTVAEANANIVKEINVDYLDNVTVHFSKPVAQKVIVRVLYETKTQHGFDNKTRKSS